MLGRRLFTLVLGSVLASLVWLVQTGMAFPDLSHTKDVHAPICSLQNLSVAVVKGSAASNQEAMLLGFRNKGRTSCTLHGYPKVVAQRSGASSTAEPSLSVYNGGWTGGAPPPPVILHPGQSASAVVEGGAVPREGASTACSHQQYKTLRVSIPGRRDSVTLSAELPKQDLSLPSCTPVRVTPFVAGIGWWNPAPFVLSADGVGVAEMGADQNGAVLAVTDSLGSPTSTRPGDCADTTEVEWGDLSLEFTSGILTGYRYLRGGLAAVGKTTHPTGPGTPLLKTSAGATLGMTLSEVRTRYPADDFSAVEGGAIVVPGTRNGDRLFLGFFASDPATPLSEIKGGSPCGDF